MNCAQRLTSRVNTTPIQNRKLRFFSMKRKILLQGDMDGACFLYSIANAFTLLTNQKITITQWSKQFEYIPFSGDFLSGNIGTKNYDDNMSLYEFAIKQAISLAYSSRKVVKKITIKLHPKIEKLNEIKQLISNNSVVILNICGEHWICAVGVDEQSNSIQAACSEIPENICSYTELKNENNKYFNRVYNINDNVYIHKNSVIELSI